MGQIITADGNKEIVKIYVGVDGKARRILRGYVGVSDKPKIIYEDIKQRGSITVSANEISLNTQRVTLYVTGTGTISVEVDNESIVSASFDGNYAITINEKSLGETFVTIKSAETEVYTEAKAVVVVHAIFNAPLYERSLQLSVGRSYSSGISHGGYAIFAGGEINNNWGSTNVVDAFNSLFVRSNPSSLSAKKRHVRAAAIENYALFGGGYCHENSDLTSTVDAYNKTLTKTRVSDLSSLKDEHSAASNNKYAIFFTDYNIDTIDSYDEYLTKQATLVCIGGGIAYSAAATAGNYALFSGGQTPGTYSLDTVYSIDDTLTQSLLNSRLPRPTLRQGATSFGTYALFGGGQDASTNHKDVVAFDSNLTESRLTDLHDARYAPGGTSVTNKFAIFAGGTHSREAESYDTSFTKQQLMDLFGNVSRGGVMAASINDYMLFAGGDLPTPVSDVSVYKAI